MVQALLALTNPPSEGIDEASTRMPFLLRFMWTVTKRFTPPVEKGIASAVFIAASPIVRADPDKYGGKYILPSGEVGVPTEQSQDLERARELVHFTSNLLKEKGIILK